MRFLPPHRLPAPPARRHHRLAALWITWIAGSLGAALFGCTSEKATIAEQRAVRPAEPLADHRPRNAGRLNPDPPNPMQATLRQPLELSPDEQTRVREILSGLRDDRVPARSLTRAMRWSDVPRALTQAVNEPGVEMAVLTTERSEDGTTIRFNLRTIEDWPAHLTIERRDDGRVYEVTEAHVGMFVNNEPRAAALVKAFHDAMTAFARKRGFE